MRSDHVAVSGNGRDMIRDRAISRLESLGTDTIGVQRVYAVPNSGPIALSRADGTRPASHVKGARRRSSVAPHSFDAVTVAWVFQQGGAGLTDAIAWRTGRCADATRGPCESGERRRAEGHLGLLR